ncbi:MAG: hypothetical protein V1696_00540 [Candidatus Jorgensenbacteria bacterium]
MKFIFPARKSILGNQRTSVAPLGCSDASSKTDGLICATGAVC